MKGTGEIITGFISKVSLRRKDFFPCIFLISGVSCTFFHSHFFPFSLLTCFLMEGGRNTAKNITKRWNCFPPNNMSPKNHSWGLVQDDGWGRKEIQGRTPGGKLEGPGSWGMRRHSQRPRNGDLYTEEGARAMKRGMWVFNPHPALQPTDRLSHKARNEPFESCSCHTSCFLLSGASLPEKKSTHPCRKSGYQNLVFL